MSSEMNKLYIEYKVLERVNFASAQNDVKIVQKLMLHNQTDEAMTDVRLSLRSSPSIIRNRIWYIDLIPAGQRHEIQETSTPLNIEHLAGLDEAEVGELEFRAEVEGLESTIEKCKIRLLARDEWGGLGDMAQILASFVSPNTPVVAALLKQAAHLLENKGIDGSMNGYQSKDPRRTYMLIGAIWSAATGLGLTYAEPPRSFEREGQKIRDPRRIKSEGLATCLDSSLLLAAAFEAAGLNSAILFSHGHASVGVWLCNKDFGHVTEPDVVAIRKAVQAHEFLPIETTLLTKRPSVEFEQSIDDGHRCFSEEREDEFVMAIDISRSRAASIRPLASHEALNTSRDTSGDEVVPAMLPKLPDWGQLPSEEVEEIPETTQGRIERWQRKLLDLSLRNRLLNYRDSQQTLPLDCPDVSALEDALAGGKKFRGLSLVDENPVGHRNIPPEEKQRIEEAFIRDAFERKQLVVPLTKKEMNDRLLALFRKANSDIQEGGANTLFLAVGFLRWKRAEDDTRTHCSPLLLVPVKLERPSAQSSFKVSHHEDDVQINSTLLEFLKKDFAVNIHELEGELPRDNSGIDVTSILETIRRKVREISGFEVVEKLALSTFSFAKYLMWKDLTEQTNQLRENRLVEHLVNGSKVTYVGQDNQNSPVEPKEVDRRLLPRDLLAPLPADSSQLAAVVAASEGEDFVIIGPPGTGKSQTITNIISQCLGNGKTVLFVAEKAAALDVVHRRLLASGLGDAVLELHSNKTNRKAVVTQLGRGWDRASETNEEQWIKITNDLKLSRDQLNAYVEALHMKSSQGFSVFDAIGCIASNKKFFERINPKKERLSYPSKDSHDKETYNGLVTLATELGQAYESVKNVLGLALICREEWSYRWEAEMLEQVEALRISLRNLKTAARNFARALGLSPNSNLGVERQSRLKALAPRAESVALDLSFVPNILPKQLIDETEACVANIQKLSSIELKTHASYSIDTLNNIPLEELDSNWREAQARFWPLSFFLRRKIRRLLQTYVVQGKGKANPSVDLEILSKRRKLNTAIKESPMAPVVEKQEKANADQLMEITRQAVVLREALNSLRPEAEDLILFDKATSELVSASEGKIRETLRNYLSAKKHVDEEIKVFLSNGGHIPKTMSIAQIDVNLENIIKKRADLPNWVLWIKKREIASKRGLSPIVKYLETGAIEGATQTEKAFRYFYAIWWLPLAMDASEELRGFICWKHEKIIETFRQLDDKANDLVPMEVMRRIYHKLPARDSVPKDSELGKLRHQLNLERPSMPIRKLISNLHETFNKLSPCVLMSPLSVSQYLPAGQATFDVVIFDEASQIPTWDAIGVIARARQTIIVGDPKQLPPTNFFGRTDDDDEDEDLPELERDMLSILDEVASAGISIRKLNWHYRSRDEALIAFSNHFYYAGKLITFPAPMTSSEAIKFHEIKSGVYARGRGRVNQEEAKAIVKVVKRYLTEWLSLPENDRYTLGIITFNAQQQSLILDLLDEIRREDNRLEWFFSDDREEPVIVKNLENIQGDERDVMLFSITFGPDLNNKLSMNFGPLNNKGGEKRLNVAITRARRKLHIFSSIRADQIDLERTRAIGVRDLKSFLDYAKRGPIALPACEEGSLGPAENPFEESVAEALSDKGWEVHTQIGVSGFRIDLSIVNPDRAGSYLAGVECDGAQYHSSATARDRDKTRQKVLEGLGWTILRIWSTEWFRDQPGVVKRVHDKLEQLLKKDQEARVKEKDQETRVKELDESNSDHQVPINLLKRPISQVELVD